MKPPLISYVTFNRMGLTIRNLTALFKSSDDFELHIIDSNSRDNTWDYISLLSDKRIKSKTRLPSNLGPIYAVNMNLARRKQGQYFISLDSDVHIYTSDWISRFIKVFENFPEVGLLGVPRAAPYPSVLPDVSLQSKNGVEYLQLKNASISVPMDFVPGHCQCMRPELIETIGYWSEECHYGDAEISARINNYTPFKVGLITGIEIDMEQSVNCSECLGRRLCKLNRENTNCFKIHRSRYRNISFVKMHGWKCKEFFKELAEKKRTAYCASIHDPHSIENHIYNVGWAKENFEYYRDNGN